VDGSPYLRHFLSRASNYFPPVIGMHPSSFIILLASAACIVVGTSLDPTADTPAATPISRQALNPNDSLNEDGKEAFFEDPHRLAVNSVPCIGCMASTKVVTIAPGPTADRLQDEL